MYQIRLVQSFSPFATTPIYSPDMQDSLPVESGHFTLELNEGGSLEFTLPYTHPYYEALTPLSSYVQATEDEEEIFYGRIYDRSEPTLTGRISYQAEGALSFLQDSEISPESKDAQGNYNTRTLTAEQFFRWCIQQHNADVADPRRQFTVGIVSASRKGETDEYQITSFTETKSALSQYILDRYGGVFRVRAGSNGTHYIDWVQDYGVTNPQPVEIGSNVTDMTNAISGDGVFTVLRPVGANGLTLTPNTINVFPAEKVAEYGRIIKTVTFGDADTEEKLRAKANTYISRIEKKMTKETQVSLVDFHFLDGNIPKIRIGHMFTNIRGMEGETMTVFNWDQDILSVDKGQFTLKNKKDLDSVTDGRVKGGTISKSSARGSRAGSLALKYYHEGTDEAMLEVKKLTATVDEAEIKIGELDVDIQGTADIAANALTISTNNLEVISRVENRVDNIEDVSIAGMEVRIQNIEGTAVIKNSDMISTVAGEFEIWEDQATGKKTVHLKDGAELAVDKDGAYITVGGLNDTLGQHEEDIAGQRLIINEMTGSALWTTRDDITEVVGEFDVIWIPDPDNPGEFIKKLKIQSGGGVVINRNNTEFGLFDEGNLTGGVIVDKINDDDYETTIKGSRVIIGDRLTDDDLSSWAQDAKYGRGVFAKYLTVKKLTAQEIETMLANINLAFLDDLEVGDINATGEIHAETFTGGDLQLSGSVDVTEDIVAGGDIWSEGGTYSDSGIYDASSGTPLRMKVVDVQPTGDILTITYNDGTTKTFEKAVTTISGSWSDGTLTVSKDPNGSSTYTAVIDSVLANGQVTYANQVLTVPVTVMVRPNGGSQAGTGYSGTLAVGAGLAYTAGQNSVNVTTDGWDSGTITFSPSAGTGASGSTKIDAVLSNGTVTYANQILSVPVKVMAKVGSGSQAETGYTTTLSVGAGLAYTAGQNSVNVNAGSWNSGSITFSPSAGTGSSASTSIDAVLSNGTVTYSNKVLSVPVKVMAKVGSGSQTETGYTSTLSVGAGLAYDAGYGDAHLTGSWDKTASSLTNNNRITISKTTSGSSNSLNYVVSAEASIEYNATTHKYTARAKAKVDGTQRGDDATTIGGTDAYDAGVTAGGNAAGLTIDVTNKKVKRSTSSTVKEYAVSAAAGIAYNTTTHKYTATATANVGGTNLASDSTTGGTEAYDAGKKAVSVTIGRSGGSTTFNPLPAGGSVTISAYKDGTAVASVTVSSNAEPTVTIARSSGNTSYNPLPAGGSVTLSAYKNGTAVSGQSITVSAPADTARTIVNNSNTSTNLQGTLTAGKYINLKNSTATGGGIVQSWYVPNAWFYAGAKPNTGPAVNEMASNDYYIWIEYHTPNGRVGSPVGNTVWHINVPSSAATLEYVGVDPNRPSDAYILNSDKQPYVITSAKATYWFLIKAMSGSTQLDAKYLGVGTNVSTSGGHNNPIKFTRGAAGTAPNTYTWSAIIGTNVTGSSTEYTFYY